MTSTATREPPNATSTQTFVKAHKRIARFKLHPVREEFKILLEALYLEQVRVIDNDRLRMKHIPPRERKATLRRWEQAFRNFLRRARGYPVIACFGSARNRVVENPAAADALEVLRLVGELAYHLGIGLMTGHFHQGFMWKCLESWLVHRAGSGHGEARRNDGVFIGGVPLMEPDNTGGGGDLLPTAMQLELLELVDALSPPKATFEGRSPAIMACAMTLLSLYGPDGIGTTEEKLRDLLGEQHKNRSLTVWTGRMDEGFREVVCLDCRLASGKWKYDWLRLKSDGDVEMATSDAKDWGRIHIVRIGDRDKLDGPIGPLVSGGVNVHWFDNHFDAAAFIVRKALEIYEAVRSAYVKMLTNGEH